MKLSRLSARLLRPFGLAVTILLILLSSLGLTLAYRQMPIDIGLDVSPGTAAPPTLQIGSPGASTSEPFKRTRYTAGASRNAFKLSPTRTKNPEALGTEVWLVDFADPDGLTVDSTGGWTASEANYVSPSTAPPSILSWEGVGAATLRFVSHPWSGMVKIETGQGTQVLDLYSANGTAVVVEVPSSEVVRFIATIRRHELANATIDLGAIPPSRLERLYLSTLVPNIRHRATRTPFEEWGNIEHGWAPSDRIIPLASSDLAPYEYGGVATFFVFASIVTLLLIVSTVVILTVAHVIRKLLSPPPPARPLEPFRTRNWLALAVPPTLISVFWWSGFYPGLVSIDTSVQWSQITTGVFNDHHPAFHTLTLKLLRLIWDSPAVVIGAQIIGLSLTISYATCLALRAGVPRWAAFAAYIIVILSPQFGHMAIALVKDTPYAIALLCLTLLLALKLLGGTPRSERSYWFAIGAILSLATLFRHNGILVTVGMAVLLPIFFWEHRRLGILGGLVALALLGGTRLGLYRAFDVQGRKFTHRATTFVWHIGAMVQQDVPLRIEEVEFLDSLRTLDTKRWLYSPTSVASLIWGDRANQLDFSRADARLDELTRLHNSLVFRHPAIFIRHFLSANSYLYAPQRPHTSREIVDLTFFLGEDTSPIREMQRIGHPLQPLAPAVKVGIRDALESSLVRDRTWSWLLWRPALFVYLCIAGVLLAIRRTGDWRFLILLGPVLLNTASLAFGVAQEARFQFPVFLSFGFLSSLAALPRRPKHALSTGAIEPPQEFVGESALLPVSSQEMSG